MLLIGESNSSLYVANRLLKEYKDLVIIQEKHHSRKKILRKRIKRQGLIKTLGEVFFIIYNGCFLKPLSKRRIYHIEKANDLSSTCLSDENRYIVDSINDIKVFSIIEKEKPDIIIVNGTRIISKSLIHFISVPLINIHVGITPAYRGVYGGYWALYNNDFKNCGVTIHYIDEGIDTGHVISQIRIQPSKKDNFNTYTTLQYAVAIPKILSILKKFEANKIIEIESEGTEESKIYSHPTLLQYIKGRLRGVK